MGAVQDIEMLGISHRTAPIDVLERLALSPRESQQLHTRLLHSSAVRDAMVLSTCNRTEVYVLPEETGAGVRLMQDALGAVVGAERLPAGNHFYRHSGRDSLQHLCRVACGLDSMVLGEAQILGQVRQAYEEAATHKALSTYFDRALQAAFSVAKKSRTETEIGRGAVSVASVAVHLATRIHASLVDQVVVVVGAGETGRLVAEHFERHQPARLCILNRTRERAEALAQQVGGEAHDLSTLHHFLGQAAVVAVAVRTPTPLLTREMIAAARQPRSGILAVLDLGLPRCVSPSVAKVENVFHYDLEAFQQVMDANLARRRKEVPRVEAMIDAELEAFDAWRRSLQVGPLITALREAVESIRKAEVERLCKGLSDQERTRVEQVTRAVVNKLLHGPMMSIREYGEDAERLKLVKDVFRNLKM